MEMAANSWNDWKWLKMAENGFQVLEMAGMAGNGWKLMEWLEMA